MNAIEFVKFLGHSSVYEPFDDFLMAQGIKWRPKVGRDLDTTHFINGHGLVIDFEFSSSVMESGFKPRSNGDYILNEFTVQFIAEDKKHGHYSGPMLHNLAINDSRADVEKKLGVKPTRVLDWGDNYFIDDLVWTVSFLNDKIKYVQLALPDDGWRKRGLCP